MIIKPSAGDSIQETFAQSIKIAKSGNIAVSFTFNDSDWQVTANDTIEEKMEEWNTYQEEKSRKWRESPEGQEYLCKLREHTNTCQANLNQAMKNWPKFQDIVSVLEWCNTIFENMIAGTRLDCDKILNEFKAHGMVSGMNLNPVYDENNKQNSGLYLVGQFLSGIKGGAIPEVFSHFYSEWRKK